MSRCYKSKRGQNILRLLKSFQVWEYFCFYWRNFAIFWGGVRKRGNEYEIEFTYIHILIALFNTILFDSTFEIIMFILVGTHCLNMYASSTCYWLMEQTTTWWYLQPSNKYNKSPQGFWMYVKSITFFSIGTLYSQVVGEGCGKQRALYVVVLHFYN